MDLRQIKDKVSEKVLGTHGIHSVGMSRKQHAIKIGVSSPLDPVELAQIQSAVESDLEDARLLVEIEGQASQRIVD